MKHSHTNTNTHIYQSEKKPEPLNRIRKIHNEKYPAGKNIG